MSKKTKKLWGGRFTRETSEIVEKFTRSYEIDQRLVRYDLLSSIAHASMLGITGIIPKTHSSRLVAALKGMLKELRGRKLHLDASSEDVHTAIQRAIERKVGKSAGYLHTARSRNDQVVTAFRLLCKEEIGSLSLLVSRLQRSILSAAESARDLVMPGYTHLQHAQPVAVSHVLLSYLSALERDKERLQDARERLDELPLGSGALTGSSLPIDRAKVARQLGFKRIAGNSVDAVTERDFVSEILSACAICAVHLSRIAEDLILWSTAEFNFVRLDERFLTGSSMMPQKQNPDFLELTRGGSSKVIGNLTAILTLTKGLSSGYQRDLQLDKEIFFSALDQMKAMLEVLSAGIKEVRWNKKALLAQLQDESIYATDLAEYLVSKGIPFSETHRIVGQLLAYANQNRVSIRSLPLKKLKKFSTLFDRGVFRLFDPTYSIRGKKSFGSTHPNKIAHALRQWRNLLRVGR